MVTAQAVQFFVNVTLEYDEHRSHEGKQHKKNKYRYLHQQTAKRVSGNLSTWTMEKAFWDFQYHSLQRAYDLKIQCIIIDFSAQA